MKPLVIQDLRKTYPDGKQALRGFNWELDDGVYGLLGPNGAGKSTLLEILSLNLMPSSGQVLWQERNIQTSPVFFRRALGYLPQTYGFYPELKARQMLSYLGGLHGMHGRTLRRRIGEVLEIVGLTAEARRKLKTFSGGMKQRLAIAQALLHSPKLLVIDEPTTGLDPSERVAFRNMLFDLGQESIVLLSTHIVKDVEFSCRQMTVLYNGLQRFTGRPVDFMNRVEGRVFEVRRSRRDFDAFAQAHHVIAFREELEDVTIRFIVPAGILDLPDGARSAPVNLEDAYVDFIRERQVIEEEEGALEAVI